jgi:hypothetical protein
MTKNRPSYDWEGVSISIEGPPEKANEMLNRIRQILLIHSEYDRQSKFKNAYKFAIYGYVYSDDDPCLYERLQTALMDLEKANQVIGELEQENHELRHQLNTQP